MKHWGRNKTQTGDWGEAN